MRYFLILFLIFFGILNAQDRVITTGVRFLMISPDARAAGMGELGVATSADAYSQQWNPAKYIFSISERGLALSYTPYLSKLVDDIFLGNLNYYKHLNDRSAWAFSLKYFSLGDIQFNELIGGSIIDQGLERPNELTLDLSYSLKLSPFFSMGIAGRYIRSDLKITSESGSKSANSLGVDVSAFYQGKEFQFTNNNKGLFRFGINISNVGPRLNYDVGGQKNFIPSNLKFGTGLDLILDSSNIFGIYLEFNKLLVPSPVSSYNELGIFQGYKQPDISFL